MSRSAKFPCRHSHCGQLLDKPGYCSVHQPRLTKTQAKNTNEDYKERNRFYQRSAWKKARAYHLSHEPLCRACRNKNRLVAATCVDHIWPITEGGAELDDSNLQSLCTSCHSRKTLAETQQVGRGG